MPFNPNITDLVSKNVEYARLAISLLGYYLHPDYAGHNVPEGNIAMWAKSSGLSTIQAFPQMFVNDYFEITSPLGMALATEMIFPLGVTPQERMGAVLAFVSANS